MTTVLLVTRSDDNDAPARVASALARRGARPLRLDTDRYPHEVALATSITARGARRTLQLGDTLVDLDALSAVWHRRFAAGVGLPPSLGDLRDPSIGEARRTLYGMMASLPASVVVVDPLESVRRCDHKERQLQVARGLGLAVPDTLITNDPAALRAFFHEQGGDVVTKLQSSFAVVRAGIEHVVYTSPLRAADLDDAAGLALCPMTFQRRVHKTLDVRAIVVGDRVLSAAVDAQRLERARLDWRKEGAALLRSWVAHRLPGDVERALVEVVRAFGLRYAAADLAVDEDGRHVFFEINAGGEWLWLDNAPGLGVAEALAELLLTPSLTPSGAAAGAG